MKSIFDFISKKSLSITLFESASAGYLAYRISQDKTLEYFWMVLLLVMTYYSRSVF